MKIKDLKTFYTPTNDNWYPSFEGNKVKITYLPKNGKLKACIICSGADDFDLIKRYDDVSQARKEFRKLLSLPFVDIATVKEMGFNH